MTSKGRRLGRRFVLLWLVVALVTYAANTTGAEGKPTGAFTLTFARAHGSPS